MAIGHLQPFREVGEARFRELAILDEPRGRLREPTIGIHGSVTGREFRTAAQAGAETLRFGSRRAREELAVVAQRHARRAHRAAVDSRGADPHEEASVEARVVGAERAVALIVIE